MKEVIAQINDFESGKTFTQIVKELRYYPKSHTVWIVNQANHYLDYDLNVCEIVLTTRG